MKSKSKRKITYREKLENRIAYLKAKLEHLEQKQRQAALQYHPGISNQMEAQKRHMAPIMNELSRKINK